MIEQNQDNFDRLLHDHIARDLDGQIGKSHKAFLRMIATKAPRRARMRWLIVTTAAAVLLAGLALWGHALMQNQNRPNETIATRPQRMAPARADVSRVVTEQVTDEGTIGMGQGAVARKYRRQIIEQTQWYDPQTHAFREDIQSHSQIVLVGSQTY